MRIKRNTDYVLSCKESNNYAIPHVWTTDSKIVNNSLVSFEIVDSINNICRIKLVNEELYLTAQSTANGAYVTWAVKDTSDAGQRWKYVPFVYGEDHIEGVNCENEVMIPFPNQSLLAQPVNLPLQYYLATQLIRV